VSVPAGSYVINAKALVEEGANGDPLFCEIKQGTGGSAPDLDRQDFVQAASNPIALLAAATFTGQTTITLRCSGDGGLADQIVLTAIKVGQLH
jgi:hypothetical protein